MKFIKYIVIMLAVQQFGFADATFSLTNYNESNSTVDVEYTSTEAVGGFQFGIDGASMDAGAGGEAASNNFTVSASSTTLLGFSFSGATLPATETPLLVTTVTLSSVTDVQLCLNGVVMSNSSGVPLTVTAGPCLTVGDIPGCTDSDACNYDPTATENNGTCEYPVDGFDCSGECSVGFDECGICGGSGVDSDSDGICDDVDDCVGAYDDCGTCNGDGVMQDCGCGTDGNFGLPDGACDCDGNIADACGACGGSETDANNCVDGYSLSFGEIDEDASTIVILYSAEAPLGGVEFEVTGATLTGASGGEATDAGWSLNASGQTFLGFSFNGSTIPQGNRVLAVVTFISDGLGGDICFNEDETFLAGPTGIETIDFTIGACVQLPGNEDLMSVMFDIDQDVSGFQFNVDGVTLVGASGGEAAENNFTVSTGTSGTVLGFSFSGDVIPAGNGVLTNLDVFGFAENGCIDESSLVISSSDGSELEAWIINCNTITYCDDADNDGVCDSVDDCIGVVDQCDICNGDGQSCLDCNDEPFGTAEVDACGVCGGNATNPLECYEFGLFFENFNGPAGTADIVYVSSVEVGGAQFNVTGINLTGASGGEADANWDVVNTSETTWLGFSLSGATLPAGTHTLSSITFDPISEGLACLEGGVLSDGSGTDLGAENGPCADAGDTPTALGCMDDVATNYDAEANIDDGSCEFPPIEIEEPEELESYDSSVDIDVPEVIFEEVELDIDIPAGALDIPEGTDVTLEASEVSEDQLQDIINNSSSSDAGVEVYEGISFEATDENGDPIELNEGATLDVTLTFDPTRDEFDLGYITADGEIVALGANCFDNGDADNSWTCIGDGPGFGSYIVYSYDPAAIIEGCTLMAACNYNENATMNDGSCQWATGLFDCDGNCTVESDCAGECGGSAQTDECNVCEGNGPAEYYNCDGNCLNDSDGDSVCDELEILGCTDSEASNYDPQATEDNGTCQSGFFFTHDLGFGNNLVSFPGYLENDSSQDLLEGLMSEGPNVVFLLGQGVGLFNTAGGWSGNLNNVAPTSGYWLNVQGSHVWDLEFTSGLESCTSYDISFGNNLLSYKWGDDNANTLVALGGEASATENFNFILGQGVGLFNTANGWSGNLNELQQGKGYWINITNSSIDFKWGFDDCASAGINSVQNTELEKQLPEEFKFTQSTEQAFYLAKDIQLDGAQPTEEDIVLAYNNDILVGSAMWTGEYTAVPVMGKDISGLTAGFCEVGDNVQFKLYQHSTGDIINLTGNADSWNSLLVTHVEKLTGSTNVELPSALTLNPAFPNPFNPVTTISYGIPTDGLVNVAIYDVNGRMIESLANGFIKAGTYSIDWNAESQPSGMYFLKVQFGNEIQSEKIMLVK